MLYDIISILDALFVAVAPVHDKSGTVLHTSTGAVIRFVVVDTGFYLSLGAERRALRLIQFSTIWGSKLQNQFNLIWYGLTRFTKVNGLI